MSKQFFLMVVLVIFDGSPGGGAFNGWCNSPAHNAVLWFGDVVDLKGTVGQCAP